MGACLLKRVPRRARGPVTWTARAVALIAALVAVAHGVPWLSAVGAAALGHYGTLTAAAVMFRGIKRLRRTVARKTRAAGRRR